jgi:hypothetical protein
MRRGRVVGVLSGPDRERAAQGARILNRLVPALDRGPGYRRDPETGFVYYSSEWLSDDAEARPVVLRRASRQ